MLLQPDDGLKLVFLLLSSWQSTTAALSSTCRKARRKDRDGDQTVPDTKPYLDENVLERKLPDADLRTIVDLPPGLDYNEWLASHSEYMFMYLLFEYYYAYVPQHMEGRLGIQCGAVDVVGEERKGHECAE